ncbi:MAG: CdaR family protein [Pyrinomonadaceae bacterium]
MTESPKRKHYFFKQIIRKIFFEDWLVKLVALGVTFALWLGVTGLSTPTTTRLSGIPLSLRFASDTEVTNSSVSEIAVIISGDNRKIAQINKNDLVASVDLTGQQPGDRVIQLNANTVRLELPLGVRLDEITPNRMAVRLEAVEEKEIPVKIETAGRLPEGFEIYSQTAVPARVAVRGPLSYTKAISQISTEKIDLTDKKADFTARQTPLAAANQKVTLLETVVDVNFKIGEKRVERMFVIPLNDGSGKKASVILFGGRTMLNNLKPEEIQIEIVKSNTGADTPQVTLPSELQYTVEIRRSKLQ